MSQPADDSPPGEWQDAPSRGDTRSRIQAVAVELFSEQGYDKTSLREIAERLGVTKAALYYHFKSKEDIVHSLVEDYFGQVDSLVAWASQQPRTPAVRAEILSRYLDMVIDSHQVYRMLQQNQAALAGLTSEKHPGRAVQGADERPRRPARGAGRGAARPGPRRRGGDRPEHRLDALPRPGG